MDMELIVIKEFLDLKIGTIIRITNPGCSSCGINNSLGFHITFNWQEALAKKFLKEKTKESFPFKVGDWIRVKKEPQEYWNPVNQTYVLNPLNNFKHSNKHPNRRSYPAIGFITEIDNFRGAEHNPTIGFSLRISNEDFGFVYRDDTKECFEKIESIKSVDELNLGGWVASPKFQTKSEKDYVVYQVVEKGKRAFKLRCLNNDLVLGQSDLENFNLIKISTEEAEKLLLLKPLVKGDVVEIVPIISGCWTKDYEKLAGQVFTMPCDFTPIKCENRMELAIQSPFPVGINYTRLCMRALKKSEVEQKPSFLFDKQLLIKKLREEFNFGINRSGFDIRGKAIHIYNHFTENDFEVNTTDKKTMILFSDSDGYKSILYDSEISGNKLTIEPLKVTYYIDNRQVYIHENVRKVSVGCKWFSYQEVISLYDMMCNNGMQIKFREMKDPLSYGDIQPIVDEVLKRMK